MGVHEDRGAVSPSIELLAENHSHSHIIEPSVSFIINVFISELDDFFKKTSRPQM